MKCWLTCLVCLLVLLASTLILAPVPRATSAASLMAPPSAAPPRPHGGARPWLRLDPRPPASVSRNGAFTCALPDAATGDPCSDGALRSPVGRDSWTDRRPLLSMPLPGAALVSPWVQPVVARSTSGGVPLQAFQGPAPFPVQVTWVRVSPRTPRTVYLGGSFGCPAAPGFQVNPCPDWVLRSTDAGTTWTDLRPVLGPPTLNVALRLSPLVMAPDGQHLYLQTVAALTPGSCVEGIIRSADGGMTWQRDQGPCYGYYYQGLVTSPLSSTRLYGILAGLGAVIRVNHSDDGGRTWDGGSTHGGAPGFVDNPYGSLGNGILVADARRLNTVYINALPDLAAVSQYVARSEDAGLTWTRVSTPTATPPLQTFAVSTDPHEGTALVGQTVDRGVPADRRYLSQDEGRTWTPTTCPGDLRGRCPAFVVDNVFGAGASYGFVRNTLVRFHGSGPATGQLALGGRLPFPTARLLAVQAGTRPGAPIYLLGQGTHGPVHGLLYRSLDGGKSWQAIGLEVLAHLAPACPDLPPDMPCANEI